MELPIVRRRTLREGRSWRWAVLAPGEIAADFTRTLHRTARIASSQLVRGPLTEHGIRLEFGVDRHTAPMTPRWPTAPWRPCTSPHPTDFTPRWRCWPWGGETRPRREALRSRCRRDRPGRSCWRAGRRFRHGSDVDALCPAVPGPSEILEHHEWRRPPRVGDVGWKIPETPRRTNLEPELPRCRAGHRRVWLWFTRFVFGGRCGSGNRRPHTADVDDQFVAVSRVRPTPARTVSASLLLQLR